MINEPKCSTGKSPKYCPHFELTRVTERLRSMNRAWRDSPLLFASMLFFYLSLMVDGQTVLIEYSLLSLESFFYSLLTKH